MPDAGCRKHKHRITRWLGRFVVVLSLVAPCGVQAAVESVSLVTVWYPYSQSAIDALIRLGRSIGPYPTDTAAAQAVFDALQIAATVSCNGQGYCYYCEPQPSGTIFCSEYGDYKSDILRPVTGCPIPTVNPTVPYTYNYATRMCERTVITYTLSLQTLSEMEPSDKTTDDSVTVIATVLDNQTPPQPKAGATVSINVDVVANSGGHNHDAGRHVSPYTGTLDTTTGITGPDGTFTFTFTAPEVSGTHTFTATCVQPTCTNNPATTKINVMVDGLAPIPVSVYYRSIFPNGDTNHPDNHNLKPEASARLAAIAKASYEAAYLLNNGLIPSVMLNDASLKWGGILDCFLTCGNSVPCGPSHHEHRRGSVVDIRARLPAINNPNNLQADTLLYEKEFIKAARDAGADPSLESSGNGRHIHLRLFGIPE